YPDHYEITVADNGAGFDPSSAPEGEERIHIGIQNVRERLASLCGGTLTFQSSAGEGTTAVITLPKGANAE
ncbi:MAG: sensor histidine kinase, partial [Clostridia bacterium]|nr:sensor histidine kinase [Clostridia bacterium]